MHNFLRGRVNSLATVVFPRVETTISLSFLKYTTKSASLCNQDGDTVKTTSALEILIYILPDNSMYFLLVLFTARVSVLGSTS